MKGGVVQELNAQATLVDQTGIEGGLTTTIARSEIEGALRDEAPPQLDLDVRRGADAQTVSVTWTRDDLERLLAEATSDQVTLTFDRGAIEQAFDDVEAHGLRGKAAVIAVAVSAAAGLAGGASAMPMGESGGTAAVSATRIADPTSGGVDPWQFNVAESSGAAAAAANPKAGQDPWQYNLGSEADAARTPAAANPKAGQDPWQYNVGSEADAARTPAAANPKAGQDPWQYNVGTAADSSPAAADPKAGMDPWQYNTLTSETGSSGGSASDDSFAIGEVGPIVGAAGLGAVLLIAGAAFVGSNRRRIPAT
jgi:hypothetical protein